MRTNLFTTVAIVIVLTLFALSLSSFNTQAYQVPGLINYQAVLRDANGSLISTGNVSLGISIHDAITGGNQLYFENHNVTPSNTGVVNVAIGGGTVISGNFLLINWGNGSKFIQVYVNNNPIGARTQLASVPYAFTANTADTANYATTALNASSATMANNINLPGSIMAYGGTTPPAGWLLCDGTSYSVNQYPNLYAVIGANFGGQSGIFNVPDFRGRFLRMVDGSAGNDPDKSSRTESNAGGNTGNNVGSKQEDAFKMHNHNALSSLLNISSGNTHVGNGGGSGYSVPTNSVGGAETRPKNVYVNYIIKY